MIFVKSFHLLRSGFIKNEKGAHGKKPGALRAPGSTQLPHNVLYYKHYLQLFNTEKVFSPWQPIWKRCEDRNDSNLSQKKGPISFIQTVTMHLTYFSFSDNVHFYVFWCLLARSKTQYQSFCDWVVWGQNRTKRCKSYFVFYLVYNFKKVLEYDQGFVFRKSMYHPKASNTSGTQNWRSMV